MKNKAILSACCAGLLLSGCASMPEVPLVSKVTHTFPQFASASEQDKKNLANLLQDSTREVGLVISEKALSEYEGDTYLFDGAVIGGVNHKESRFFNKGRIDDDISVVLRREKISGKYVHEDLASPIVRIYYDMKTTGELTGSPSKFVLSSQGDKQKKALKETIDKNAFIFNQLIDKAHTLVIEKYNSEIKDYFSWKKQSDSIPLVSDESNFSLIPEADRKEIIKSFEGAQSWDFVNSAQCYHKHFNSSQWRYRDCIIKNTATGNYKVVVNTSDHSLEIAGIKVRSLNIGNTMSNEDLSLTYSKRGVFAVENKTDSFIEITNTSESYGGSVYQGVLVGDKITLAPKSVTEIDLVSRKDSRVVEFKAGQTLMSKYKLTVKYEVNGKQKYLNKDFSSVAKVSAEKFM